MHVSTYTGTYIPKCLSEFVSTACHSITLMFIQFLLAVNVSAVAELQCFSSALLINVQKENKMHKYIYTCFLLHTQLHLHTRFA